MTNAKRNCQKTRNALRDYLLETLSDREHRAAADHMDECPSCREALAAEKQHLAVLRESMPIDMSPEDLAERTVIQVTTAAGNRRAPRVTLIESVVGVAIIAILSAFLLPALERSREAARRATTQNNMKQLAIVFKMYANESEGEQWPELDVSRAGWNFNLAALHEQYLSDPGILVSESHPDAAKLKESIRNALAGPNPDFDTASEHLGESFAYMGYAVGNETDFVALHTARADDQLPAPGDELVTMGGSAVIPPLREGVERFLITDINNAAASAQGQSNIPVLVEIAGWKDVALRESFIGANVLYMDGHVEYTRLGTFPVLPAIMDVLSGLAP